MITQLKPTLAWVWDRKFVALALLLISSSFLLCLGALGSSQDRVRELKLSWQTEGELKLSHAQKAKALATQSVMLAWFSWSVLGLSSGALLLSWRLAEPVGRGFAWSLVTLLVCFWVMLAR
jgi:hypothetical protein